MTIVRKIRKIVLGVDPGGSETLGSYAGMDLEEYEIYRIDMSLEDYPTFLDAGATCTHEPNASWDGGACAKLTPPVSGGTDGHSGLGGFALDKGGTFAIHKLNIRWEASFGSTFVTNWRGGADMKWVIAHTGPALGDTSTNQRPMVNWQKPDPGSDEVFVAAVGAGTLKQFDPAPSAPPQYGPDINTADFFMGSTAGTLSGEPVIGPNTWLSFQLEIISESTVEAPNGRIRLIVSDSTGAILTDFNIAWDYDSNWTLPRFIHTVLVIGGFFNELYATSDANTYQKITGVTFAANRVGLLPQRLE